MKELAARTVLIAADMLMILLSVAAAYLLRWWFDGTLLPALEAPIRFDSTMLLLHTVTFSALVWEGVYTKRYDFWQEYKRLFRALFVACAIVLALLALGDAIRAYSRFVLLSSFALLFVFLPVGKYLLKHILHHLRLWGREAAVVGNDPFLEREIFGNPYLGYVRSGENDARTLFIASEGRTVPAIEAILDSTVKHKQEVIFLPLIKSYDFSDSYIVHLFNARTNLVVLENKLLDPFNRGLKHLSDYLLTLLILPAAFAVMGVIALLIKRAEPSEPVLFRQTRLGLDGSPFVCYKFRSMRTDSEALLAEYLRDNPEEVDNYELYHKYAADPRITPIGAFLRKTSLDELPQIINVIRGEMSLIGPRPYMPEERGDIGEKSSLILVVKPGITGMWQVSGRSCVDFSSRVELDTWYVRNWSLWTDFVIFVKTLKVVLRREGAM